MDLKVSLIGWDQGGSYRWFHQLNKDRLSKASAPMSQINAGQVRGRCSVVAAVPLLIGCRFVLGIDHEP